MMESALRKLMLVTTVGLLAGCALPFGGSSSGGNNSSGSSEAKKGPGIAGTVTLNKEFWFAGFHVTLGEAAYKPPVKPSPGQAATEGQLTLQAKFENLGKTNATFQTEVTAKSTDNQYTYAGKDDKRPAVPGKAIGSGVIALDVDEKFNLDDAVVTVGNARTNQAVIPLGGTGKLVNLQPQKLATTGVVALPSAYSLNFTGGTLSYDQPDRHQELEPGSAFLQLNLSITGNSDHYASFSTNNVSLKVPDGTAITSEDLEPCCNAPAKGTTKQDGFLTFIIKAPFDGAYDLIFKGTYGPNSTEESADLNFSISTGGGSSASPGSSTVSSPGSTGATPSGH